MQSYHDVQSVTLDFIQEKETFRVKLWLMFYMER